MNDEKSIVNTKLTKVTPAGNMEELDTAPLKAAGELIVNSPDAPLSESLHAVKQSPLKANISVQCTVVKVSWILASFAFYTDCLAHSRITQGKWGMYSYPFVLISPQNGLVSGVTMQYQLI